MNIETLKNGNLAMTAYVVVREAIKRLRTMTSSEIESESIFISEFLGGDPMGDGKSYEQVAPEEVGALTSAPIISDGENIYGFMDYQISNFLEELAEGKTIIWQKG